MLSIFALALAAPAVAALPPCNANQLSLGFDGLNGSFNGMSHGGTLLVIRNLGPKACRIEGLPRLTFKDGEGKPLPIIRRAPRGLRPGPVVTPVGIAAGAELTAPLRWVSGEVYDRNLCLTAAYVAVTVGKEALQGPLGARLCGQVGADIGFEQPILRPDPVLK